MRRGLVLIVSFWAVFGCSADTLTTAAGPENRPAATPVDRESTVEPTEQPSKKPNEDKGIRWPRRGHFYTRLIYPDGVSIEVISVKHTKLSRFGRAKGIQVGDPIQILAVTIANGSAKKLSLDAPSSRVTYGPDGAKAASVRDRGIDPLAGSLPAGRAKTGTYGFAVPRSYHTLVWLQFSFDSKHDHAVINGPLT